MSQQMADASHWQVHVDFDKYPYKRIGLKATEGSGIDPDYLLRAVAAAGHHVSVDHYCFAVAGNPVAQAQFFVKTIAGHFRPGDRAVIDAEAAGVNGAFVAAFIAEVVRLQPHWPAGLIYGSPYFLRDGKITSSHGWGLWLADYTTASKPEMVPPGFPAKGDYQWQFSSGATVAGISGKCDLSRIIRGPNPPLKATNLTVWQSHKATKLVNASDGFVRAMDNRKHPLADKGRAHVTAAQNAADHSVNAAIHAKGIKP